MFYLMDTFTAAAIFSIDRVPEEVCLTADGAMGLPFTRQGAQL
jgi:hypothetical protein